MPACEPIAHKSHLAARVSIGSLVVTVLLCIPTLVGAVAYVFNLLLYRNFAQWEQTSSALVALGVFWGGPLVALAAVVGAIIGAIGSVPIRIKYAHLLVVSLAAVAALSLLLRFGTLAPLR